MKTNFLNIDMRDFKVKFRELNRESPTPSPYFIPIRIFISTDDLLNKTNIQFFYINREPEKAVNFENISVSLGALTGKIQSLTFEGKDIPQLFEKLMGDQKIFHKEIINTVFKNYILKV